MSENIEGELKNQDEIVESKEEKMEEVNNDETKCDNTEESKGRSFSKDFIYPFFQILHSRSES